MNVGADKSEPLTAVHTDLGAIFVSLELSRSSWLITSLSPGGGEKMSKHSVPGGDFAGLSVCPHGAIGHQHPSDKDRRRSIACEAYIRSQQHEGTGPMPVMISRSARWPRRTTRCWPVSVLRSACLAKNSATSASTAWVRSARAPLRRISSGNR
jgi:hypothetical protein